MTPPYIKLKRPLNDLALVCRGCLAESGEMKDMLEWGLAEDFFQITKVKVTAEDAMSTLLCGTCESSLVMCKTFTIQCQSSDVALMETAKKKSEAKNLADTSIDNPTHHNENIVTCNVYDDKIIIDIQAPDMTEKIYLPCPYSERCMEKFIKKKHLSAHLVKKHGRSFTDIQLKYYCSFPDCSYRMYDSRNKCFSERKFLNQHYNKVHKSKDYHCKDCSQSFASLSESMRHSKTCKVIYYCDLCNIRYKTNERLLVHLMRKHPELHKQYKIKRRAKAGADVEAKRPKTDSEKLSEFIYDSPKRSLATQTLNQDDNIRNDVSLASCQSTPGKSDVYGIKTDEISTQTVFEDLLSLKSQNSEDDSMFFSETASLTDIQTQTFPVEFGLSRSNKETITSETQSPDLSIKETQTCFCLYDSPKLNFRFDNVSGSPSSSNLTSTETQTGEFRFNVKSDVMLGFNSAETQTSFDEGMKAL